MMTRGLSLAAAAFLAMSHTLAVAEPSSKALVERYAAKHRVPARLAHGVVRVESGYRCSAKNPTSSATGIMQVIKGTARELGVRGDLRNCRTGLDAGMRYLRLALDRGGEGCAGVSLYERGIYAQPRCTTYGRRVMRAAP